MSTGRHPTLLRWTLMANALTSGLSAALMIFASNAVSNLIGLTPAQIMSLGIELAVFVALIAVVLRRSDLGGGWVRPAILGIIALDLLWVVGSAVALLSPAAPFTPAGRWIVLGVAFVVADFAALQLYGWLGMRKHLHPSPAA